jgi:hypothetical protein
MLSLHLSFLFEIRREKRLKRKETRRENKIKCVLNRRLK